MPINELNHRRFEHVYWAATVATSLIIAACTIFSIYVSVRAIQLSNDNVTAITTQNKVILDQEQRSLRAYLYVQNVSFKSSDAPDKTKNVVMNISIVDGGATPAYQAKTWTYGEIAPYPMSESVRLDFVGRINQLKADPQATLNNSPYKDYNINIFDTFSTGLSSKDYRDLAAQKAERIYFYGMTEYNDTFAMPHWHRFCFSLLREFTTGAEDAPIDRCPFLNDADFEQIPTTAPR